MESSRLILIAATGCDIGTFVAMTVSGMVAQYLNWRWIFYFSGKLIDKYSVFPLKSIRFRNFGSTMECPMDIDYQ